MLESFIIEQFLIGLNDYELKSKLCDLGLMDLNSILGVTNRHEENKSLLSALSYRGGQTAYYGSTTPSQNTLMSSNYNYNMSPRSDSTSYDNQMKPADTQQRNYNGSRQVSFGPEQTNRYNTQSRSNYSPSRSTSDRINCYKFGQLGHYASSCPNVENKGNDPAKIYNGIVNDWPIYIGLVADLNTCIEDLENKDSEKLWLRNCIGTVNVIHNLIEASPKRHQIFKKIQSDFVGEAISLKSTSETRWSSRDRAFKAIRQNLNSIHIKKYEGSLKEVTNYEDIKEQYNAQVERLTTELINQLKERFSDDLEPISFIYDILLDEKLKVNRDLLEAKLDIYRDIIDFQNVLCEIQVWKNYIKNQPEFINEDSCIQKLKDFFGKNNLKNLFPNINKLFQIYLTIPVSSATPERTFSCLKRIKTWLRNSIGQERVSNLAVLNIEKEEIEELDLD
ncbi:unnamed protein product, partial [Brachionus calyciflorus]